MKYGHKGMITKLMIGASVVAMSGMATVAHAQDADDDEDEIVVTGIRASLQKSMNVKRDAKGIVDAITAEDIGKFPDTNLAESLQRIPGVAIDRNLGEGATVTVRGWGADQNLVTFNGRYVPTSNSGDLGSRSFDFGNLASEGIAAVELYKTSKAHVSSGGAGATINIKTTKPLEAPGLTATFGTKAVYDSGQVEADKISPEVSFLVSNTFMDDRFGVAVSGSYQKREGGFTQSNIGWRDGYLGSSDFDNEWGRLPSADQWNWNPDQGANRPGDTDVYEVPQNGDYALTDIKRERINGHLTLQFDVTSDLRLTADATYSSNEVETNTSSAGVWFDHNSTRSAWTDGPVAGPLYYTEFFGGTDLSYSGSLAASKNENLSLGFNADWQVTDRLNLNFDFHNSTAESGPANNYGTSMSLGTTVFGIQEQTINFENDLPVISIVDNGTDPFLASNRQVSGSTFANNYMKSEIQQAQLRGSYDLDFALADSVDFGAGWLENSFNNESGFIQTDSWGGLGSPDDVPDDWFEWLTLPDKFEGVSGAEDPNMLPGIYRFDFDQMIGLAENLYNICSNPWVGSTSDNPGTCLANRTNSQSLTEETFSAYLQFNNSFYMGELPVNLTIGARYEHTDIVAPAETTLWTGSRWPGGNEFFLITDESTVTTLDEGSYDEFLPSVDFDMNLLEDVKLRMSYSKTMARQRYNTLQPSLTLDSLFRADAGTGRSGNPTLEPFTSKNYDVSAEWYYDDNSYISIGYFKKSIDGFVGSETYRRGGFGLTHPGQSAIASEARNTLPTDALGVEVVGWYQDNYPTLVSHDDPNRDCSVDISGCYIIGVSSDPELFFDIDRPVVSDRTDGFNGWEFAIQHDIGDTGFGIIANYTIAETELEYDNTQPYRILQIALPGVSDNANLIGYYDKNGLQARVAWNWREKFLSGSGNNPFYIEDYSQIDANISYEIKDGFTVFAEGIDITGTDRRGHRRHENNVFFMNPQKGRYAVGARYKF